MITIQKKPYLCSFSKNPIDFEIKTDLQYETAIVYPELVLLFINLPVVATNYLISFTNPENGNREEVNLIAVDGSNAENYAYSWQIPDTNFTGSMLEFRNIVLKKLTEFGIFNAYYKIEKPIVEFPGSTPRITIIAKHSISELVMEWNSNQPELEINKYIREANSVTYHQPGVREGYELKASLYMETNYGTGNYNLITTIDCILNENSVSYVDVSKYLDSEIESSWNEYPLPFEKQLGYKASNLRKYYVEFYESFSNESESFKIKSEILYTHWGGSSADDQYNLNGLVSLNTNLQWLTWWPSGKRILIDQNDWLGWMNNAENNVITISCQIRTNYRNINLFPYVDIELDPFETFIINTGFKANNLDESLNEGEIVKFWSWKVIFGEIIKEFRYYPIDNCLAKQIVFFNSFGIPESFLLSAEFEQNITTSQELAVRTQSFAINNKLPQNYIFDSKNIISYNAQTIMLSNLEAERLMPLINSTITFLRENNTYLPVIINAGSSAIYKVNSFLQTIKVELVRANESDRISYFEPLPDFEISTGLTIGISICSLIRNLLNITDFGSILIYKNNEQIGEFAWNGNFYTGDAILNEGLLTFKLICKIDGIEKIVQKQFIHQWEELNYEIVYTGENADIRLNSFIPNTPIRIEWADGISEVTTINGLTAFTKSYSTSGKKINRIFKPGFFDIVELVILKTSNLFDISKFTNLQTAVFENCIAGNYYFSSLKKLITIIFSNTIIHQLNIGYQKEIENIVLENTEISTENFELLIKEIWIFRKGYVNNFNISISSEIIISDTAQSIIDGTGIYSGDGLNTYGITILNL